MVRRVGEGVLDAGLVAVFPVEAEIAGRRLPDLRPGGRGGQRAGGVERFVVHRDEFGGVLGLGVGFGDHHGDGFADEGDAATGEDFLGRGLGRGAVAALDRRHQRHGLGAERLDVVIGQDIDHARRGLGGGDVDREDFRVAVRAAVETGESLVVKAQIVRILTLTGDEADILGAFDRLANAELHACRPLPIFSNIIVFDFAKGRLPLHPFGVPLPRFAGEDR